MANSSSGVIYVPTTLGSNSFRLKHKDDSIFFKEFNSESLQTIDLTNNTIRINNHFFNTGEKIFYSYPNSGKPISISPSSPGNTISTTFLPKELYPIVIDDNTIKLAFTKQLSLSGQEIDLTNYGIGNKHSFECEKQNSKCLITIDNIIQSPLSIASTVGIVSFVDSRNIVLSNLNDINVGTILKIGSEYTKVVNISYSNNNVGLGTVTVLRGINVLGTAQTVFSNEIKYVSIVSGQYNIVKDKIYFTDSPFEGKRFNYDIPLSDVNDGSDSFNLFNSNIRTGSVLTLISQNPPKGLISNRVYFAIKNSENNFSFAISYQNAVSGVKVSFDKTLGQYDELTPVLPFKLSFLDFSFGSKFVGRAFLRSNYDGNNVFDDISSQFNGITTSFELKSSGLSTSGISTDNGIVLVNNIFQYPEFGESFAYREQSNKTFLDFVGIGTTGDTYKEYDVNVKGNPRGGIIVGYGLSSGKNYQPLKTAILYETFKQEDSGTYTINNDNIGIAYSGSGYRYPVGYSVSISFEQNGERISGYGTATISSGYISSFNIIEPCTYTNGISTPFIRIDSPLEYENLQVSGSTSGIGARVNLKISDSGDVEGFRFINPGYGYTSGEILSIPVLVGASTQVSSDQLKIIILSTTKDTFSAWNIGKLRKLDDLTSFVNGTRRTFSLRENSQLLSLESNPGSNIEISQNLLVFVNDILQIPNESYTFNGGTQITLSEAPPAGSTLRVYFYMGSDGDAILNDIDPKIKIGDNLQIKKNIEQNPVTQFSRTVKRIVSSDSLKTEIYNKKGLSYDSSTYRSVDFTPQSKDMIIGGEIISKARDSLSSKYVGFSSIATRNATFSSTNATTIGIDTSSLQINDFVESDYTLYHTIVSIGASVIGLSTSASNTSTGTYQVKIWRKIP